MIDTYQETIQILVIKLGIIDCVNIAIRIIFCNVFEYICRPHGTWPHVNNNV